MIKHYAMTELTVNNTNEEFVKSAFDFVQEVGYMIFATISVTGKLTSRCLEVHHLDDSDTLYIGVAQGKPVYKELTKNPYITADVARQLHGRLNESVRINSHVEEIPQSDTAIYDRYWELNPGTKALYRRELSQFKIFRLDVGEGEIFYLPEDDTTCRLRFTFGGGTARKWAYEIDTEKCIGCGVCVDECMENVISINDEGKAEIFHFNCLECGRCMEFCPNDAVRCDIE